MTELIDDKGLSSQLRTLIRYLASGLVTILLVNLLELKIPIIPDISNASWSLLIVASLIGLLNYCLHASVADNWFYCCAICKIRKCKKYSSYLPDFIVTSDQPAVKQAEGSANSGAGKNNRLPQSEVMFRLNEYRLKREGTTNPKLVAMLKRLDQYLTFMSFLYTSSYSMVILVAYYSMGNLYAYNWNVDSLEIDLSAAAVIFLAILFIFLGFLLDLKVTKWEMWFIKNYQSTGINPDAEADKNLYPVVQAK